MMVGAFIMYVLRPPENRRPYALRPYANKVIVVKFCPTFTIRKSVKGFHTTVPEAFWYTTIKTTFATRPTLCVNRPKNALNDLSSDFAPLTLLSVKRVP